MAACADSPMENTRPLASFPIMIGACLWPREPVAVIPGMAQAAGYWVTRGRNAQEEPMSAMTDHEPEEVRVHGHLPHMDIDIIYRRAREGDREFIAINVETLPLSQAFERVLMMSNPFFFWAQVAEAAWRPWLQSPHAATPAGRLQSPAED